MTGQAVPMWPVVVPLTAVACALLLHRMRRRGVLTGPRALLVATACVYLAGVVANTVWPMVLGRRRTTPWQVYLDLVPLSGTELVDAAGNVVVFLPLGFLLPLLLRRASAVRVVSAGAALSLAMEVVQFVNALTLAGGHVADVDDWLANTAGAALGYALLLGARRVPAVARGLRALALHPGTPAPPVTRTPPPRPAAGAPTTAAAGRTRRR
ncbi:VanZ like family protein [Klenkia soli]|uniref:VanZ like family protein n=1 Tax=Klenkia soli TaxID=1052260 RepID=A0A1H0GML3_9ACTN|nr:VanZ family protein [Klenkia soli]SDO08022.1 VanZ like family protein [Klenkia soli]